MRIKYQKLFTVELTNGYFDSGVWKDISFVPLPETEKLMHDNGYAFRQIGNELLVMTRVNAANKPLVVPPLFEKFSFRLVSHDSDFFYYTNLPMAGSQTPCLYFHNRHQNPADGAFCLTHALPDYNSDTAYAPGDFVSVPGGHVYECIQTNPAGASSIPADDVHPECAAYWAKLEHTPYVSPADGRVEHNGTRYALRPTGAAYMHYASVAQPAYVVRVYAMGHTGSYNRLVKSQQITYPEPNAQVPINLQGLPAGCYILQVGNDIQAVFLHPFAHEQLMAMDIFHLPDSAPQALLNADNSLRNPRYRIAFSARRVLWRYKTRTDAVDHIEDSSGTYTFKPDGDRVFVSETPIPLSRNPLKSLTAKSGAIKLSTPLANPQPKRLTATPNEPYSAEAFINF